MEIPEILERNKKILGLLNRKKKIDSIECPRCHKKVNINFSHISFACKFCGEKLGLNSAHFFKKRNLKKYNLKHVNSTLYRYYKFAFDKK